MKTERPPFPWPLFAVTAAVALAVGFAIGTSPIGRVTGHPEMQDWNGSYAQAEDAMKRWAPKAIGHGTPEQMLALVRKHYSPRLMAYPEKNCIQLEPDGVGGAPIYCYRANSLDLEEEYSDVE